MTATWTLPRTWATGEIVTAAQLNEQLRDNFDWLKGRPYGSETDLDYTVFSTTSSSFQDSGIRASLTTTGGRVAVFCAGTIALANPGSRAHLTIHQDATNVGDTTYGLQCCVQYDTATDSEVPFCMVWITPSAPTAAAHTWDLYVKSDGSNNVHVRQAAIYALEIGV